MTIVTQTVQKGLPRVMETLAEFGIRNLRRVNETCISGATLEKYVPSLGELKKAGISTIIDFRSEASTKFAQQCKESGFQYILFPLEHTREGLSGIAKMTEGNNAISNKFVQQLKEFISTINEGNAYMGCNYGIDRTNLGLVLNYLLNPKSQLPPKILTWGDFRTKSVINKTLKTARKMIKKMTPEQRASLGLSDNYNELFQQKIAKLLAQNSYS